MPRRRIGQERLFEDPPKVTPLDEIATLIDWSVVAMHLDVIYSAPRGEASWPPLAMFKAMLLAIWYDLSDVKLAEALDDRASFRPPVLRVLALGGDPGAHGLCSISQSAGGQGA